MLRTSAAIMTIAATTCVLAQPAPDGFDWVTIGATGNRGWNRTEDIPGTVIGRGAVNYEYRIARTETTTAQWMEFINTFSARADRPNWLTTPLNWGAAVDQTYAGPGVRYALSSAYTNPQMHPVGGIGWREAARFCNWLHNGKSPDLAATENGAYDTSTFGYDQFGRFTDQREHNTDARYWIPTWDEWLKAAHYDPVRDYWWQFSNGMDRPSLGAPPGVGEANSGFSLPGSVHIHIPLASYPHTQSPWGLLDTSGVTTEWTETTYELDDVVPQRVRVILGSWYGGPGDSDDGRGFGGLPPEDALGGATGLRVASVIPTPGAVYSLLIAIAGISGCRRNRE